MRIAEETCLLLDAGKPRPKNIHFLRHVKTCLVADSKVYRWMLIISSNLQALNTDKQALYKYNHLMESKPQSNTNYNLLVKPGEYHPILEEISCRVIIF